MGQPTVRQLQWMESIQRIYVEGDDDKLYLLLRPVLERQARISAKQWKWTQMEYEDFCSAFWEMTWTVVVKPYRPSKYLFYQTWKLALRRLTISLVRQATQRKQSEFDNGVIRVGNEVAELTCATDNVEQSVTDRMYVDWLLEQLDSVDRHIAMAVLDSPDTSMNGIAAMTGYDSGKTVARRLRQMAKVVTINE